MSSKDLVLDVEDFYRELDEHIERTTLSTGMKCVHLCNVCCVKTDIEASPLEFIPLAAFLYKTGQVDEFITLLDKAEETGYCALLMPEAWKEGKWGCRYYEKRGLICRMFGFGYRLNQEEIPEIVTCKILKDKSPGAIQNANVLGRKTPEDVPLFRNYSMKLFSIDPDLSINLLPINQAIRIAIEKLYFDYALRIDDEDRYLR